MQQEILIISQIRHKNTTYFFPKINPRLLAGIDSLFRLQVVDQSSYGGLLFCRARVGGLTADVERRLDVALLDGAIEHGKFGFTVGLRHKLLKRDCLTTSFPGN